MSRTHLYRGANPAPRPLATLVLAGAWTGAAVAALLATAPVASDITGAAPLAAYDRLFFVVAVAGAAIGVTLTLNELVAGRSRWRAARLVGAALLAVAGGIGALDATRDAARPGGVPEAIAAEPAPDARAGDAAVAGQRLLWTSLGLAGSGLVLVGGMAAARRSRADA